MSPLGGASPVRILNVDDYDPGRYAITRLLVNEGFSVVEAATGEQALRLVADCPDLVILDINLPDMSGLDVCRRIKADPHTASVPVLHLSATHVQSDDRARGLAGGADAYLTEPINPPELIATIHALLRMRRSEERARTIAYEWQATFDAINDGVAVLDHDGFVVRFNRALALLIGGPDTSLIGRSHQDLIPLGAPSPFVRMLQTGRRETADVPRGSQWLRVTADPLVDERGAVTGAIYLVGDITHHKLAEQEILKTGKLEALGVLAGGIAHDFNNTLTAIVGHLSLAKLAVDPASRIAARLKEAAAVCLKARDLTQQLLTFARGGTPVKKRVAVDVFLRSYAGVTLGPHAVSCHVVVPPGIGAVIADEDQLRQVLNHLLINAHEAMPEGGLILLEAEPIVVDTQGGPPLAEGRYVRIAVRDEGIGIPSEYLSRIFDPFFTTKANHSGLGLTTAYSIVKKHEGHIRVESAPGVGSTFTVYLPVAEEASPRQDRQPDRPRGNKILFMDDDASIRNAFCELLIAEGYEVDCVRDGREAVSAYRTAHESNRPFDAVVLDLTVAGGAMGGLETIRHLREIDPSVKAIVSSGYSNDPVMADCRAYGFADVLMKPYQLDDLIRALTALLGEGPSR